MSLTVRQLRTYLSHIPRIRASELLDSAMVASVPHLEAEARQELLDAWQEDAGLGARDEQVERVSFEDFVTEIRKGI